MRNLLKIQNGTRHQSIKSSHNPQKESPFCYGKLAIILTRESTNLRMIVYCISYATTSSLTSNTIPSTPHVSASWANVMDTSTSSTKLGCKSLIQFTIMGDLAAKPTTLDSKFIVWRLTKPELKDQKFVSSTLTPSILPTNDSIAGILVSIMPKRGQGTKRTSSLLSSYDSGTSISR